MCDPEFNCKNFFLFFLLVDMMSSKRNNPEKTLDYVVATQPALSPSLDSAFLYFGLAFFLVFFSCPLILNNTPPPHTHTLMHLIWSALWGAFPGEIRLISEFLIPSVGAQALAPLTTPQEVEGERQA